MATITIPATPAGKDKSRERRKRKVRIRINKKYYSEEEYEKYRNDLNEAREEIERTCKELDEYLSAIKGK